jgi:hypothetical protein
MTQGNDDGWVALEPSPWWTPVFGIHLAGAFAFAPMFALQLSAMFELSPIWWLPLAVGFTALTCVASVVLTRLAHPRGFLHPTTSTLRTGRTRFGYADVTEARLVPSTSKKRRALLLVLYTKKRLRTTVLVRDAKQRTLDPAVAALVLDMLQQTNIEMPVSPDDPKGRFARFNFPANITKHEALEVLAHPPLPADPLPISLST